MMEGWTAAHPQSAANWSVERDVFTWLEFGTSIENVIGMYDGTTTNKKASTLAEKVNAHWLAWQYGKCHHQVNTWLRACPVCDEQDRACITYLIGLKARITEYDQAREKYKSSEQNETRDYRNRADKYHRALGIAQGAQPAEIKRRYRELVRMWHPDQYSSQPSRQRHAVLNHLKCNFGRGC